ncbi:MAG: LacI family DNA-binding transcriptional regulator [Planctomycetota bacterium]
MAVTIKDIARLAGVNHSTVSRALRDDARVSASTRRRIKGLARRQGYRVNRRARALVTGEMANVGVVVAVERESPLTHTFNALDWIEFLDGALHARGLELTLLAAPIVAPLEADEARLPERVLEMRVDGLIVANHMTAALARALRNLEVPFVDVNGPMVKRVCTINIDEEKTTSVLVDHLAGLGHEAIAFVNSSHDNRFRTRLRARGYEQAMAERGLRPFRRWDALRPLEQACQDLFGQDPVPTAVICYDDTGAAYFERFLSIRGYDVPHGVSLASAHAVYFPLFLPISLTRMARPYAELAVLAVDALLSIAKGEGEKGRSMTLEPALELGESTAKPGSESLPGKEVKLTGSTVNYPGKR